MIVRSDNYCGTLHFFMELNAISFFYYFCKKALLKGYYKYKNTFVMNLQNPNLRPLDGVVVSMIDLKKIGKMRMDTCSCESVETIDQTHMDDEGNCVCNSETITINHKDYYCNCDDN